MSISKDRKLFLSVKYTGVYLTAIRLLSVNIRRYLLNLNNNRVDAIFYG